MFKKSLLILVCVLSCLLTIPVLAQVGIDNAKNPFVTEKHSGQAHEVSVPGAFDGSEDDAGQEDALVNVIKGWVNWVLGLLGLIALIILIYGGLLMVTASGNEERYNKGRTILKHAAIGLVMIGVAWFIVSLIFWLINLSTDQAGVADTDQ